VVSRWLSTLQQCDGELGLRAAQLEVGARHFRGDRHLGIAQARLRPLDFRVPCLDAAAHATEEVQLQNASKPAW